MSKQNPDCPIFVINLDRDTKRLASIDRAIAALGRSYERVRAIDGRYRFGLIKRCIHGPMSSPRSRKALTIREVACVLSHLVALRRVIRRRLPIALILEDDAEWSAKFGHFLSADLSSFMMCCDVLKVEALRFAGQKPRGFVLANGTTAQLLIPFAPGVGAAGYVVTLAGAQRLARALGRLEEPVDFVLARFEMFDIVLGETRPALVWQGRYETNLEPERWASAIPARGPVAFVRRAANWVARFVGRSRLLFAALIRRARQLCRIA